MVSIFFEWLLRVCSGYKIHFFLLSIKLQGRLSVYPEQEIFFSFFVFIKDFLVVTMKFAKAWTRWYTRACF